MNVDKEAIVWAYRLFLDRDPESNQLVDDACQRLKCSKDIRSEFLASEEFKLKNPGVKPLSMTGHEPPMHIEACDDLDELFFHIKSVWESLGNTEPYWSVLTFDDYKSCNSEKQKEEFYASGFWEVEKLFSSLDRVGVNHKNLKTCLEYGCGLGRVTNWLSRRFENVIGFDISEPHLMLARKYLDDAGVSNVTLKHIKTPQDIGGFPKSDLVYSIIVLQHNPPPIIKLIIKHLLRSLNSGGVAFFQVPTYKLGYRFELKDYISTEFSKKHMEMHLLPQRDIFTIIAEEQCQLIEVLEDNATGLPPGEISNTFVVRKHEVV